MHIGGQAWNIYIPGNVADRWDGKRGYKRLASQLAVKWDQPYSVTMGWLQCGLSYSLLRSSIQCLRGAHSSCGHVIGLGAVTLPVELICVEARV